MLDACGALSPSADEATAETHNDITQDSLAATAGALLRTRFAAWGNTPSASQWAALDDVLRTMEAMATGTADQQIFLAALDCGVGKSKATLAFAETLARSAEHCAVGMIVCVGRREEAHDMAEALKAAGVTSFAVRVGKEEFNALSGAPANEAAILLTTQQKLEFETRHRAFRDASFFYYLGAPRQVRVWDEAFSPGLTITLDDDALAALWRPASFVSGEFREALKKLTLDLGSTEHEGTLEIPDWTERYGVTETQLLDALKGADKGELQQTTASGLFLISGKTVRVIRISYSKDGVGRSMISYEDTLPEDLKPVLVLDASIRVRRTYANAIQHRNYVPLRPGTKTYENLTVHCWSTSASKSGFDRNGDQLIKGIADTVQTKPDQEWLLVHHLDKPSARANGRDETFPTLVRRLLPNGMKEKVKFLSWGNNIDTNAHKEVPNVVLCGTLFLPHSQYVALTHQSQDRRPEIHGIADKQEIAATMYGEHLNLILQAACRGTVRRLVNGACAPMALYLIASLSSRIPRTETVETLFPGARMVRWAPFAPVMRGRLADAAEVLRKMVEEGCLRTADDFLPYHRIAEVMPDKKGQPRRMQPNNFVERVTSREEWKNHLVSLGLAEAARGNRRGKATPGLRLAMDEELTDWRTGGLEGGAVNLSIGH